MEYYNYYSSPLGKIVFASDGESLTGLWLEGQMYFGQSLSSSAEKRDLPVFSRTEQWLAAYFRGEAPACTVPLAPKGSQFRQSVLKKLLAIPYGSVTTYGDIAKQMAAEMGRATMSAQAVGGAVGHNPISIIIPCHRVVGSNGSLTGYAGGIDKKIKLLQIEKVDVSKFLIPKSV
ncbi:MAG: methylated-DNA--[protein]-cysteine S-methyltransferase [Planctomycetes bacterium]|nr:methylated-DNA--[protein]-cysteine S-methyltransferase [Planctomycetota bacterium]